MNKNIIKIGLFTLLVSGSTLTLNSCRDAIDIVQDGEVNDAVFFSSVSNMQNFLDGGVYGNFQAALPIYFTSVITDELKPGSGSGGQAYNEHRHFVNSSTSFVETIWLQNNAIINNVNRLIEGAKKITPSSSEEARYNNILAQAKAVRAFAYLQLLTYFSEDMTNGDALGAIVFTDVPTISTQQPRATNSEVYKLMEEDLDFAKQHLSRSTSSRYFADLNFVDAVTARMNLYRGNYAAAKVAAKSILDNSGLSLASALPVPAGVTGSTEWNNDFYGSPSTSPYRNIWNDSYEGQSEVIFALSRLDGATNGAAVGGYYNTNRSDITGSPYWAMGRNLFNIINSTEGDIRRYAYLDPTSLISATYLSDADPTTTDQLIIDKYPGKGNSALRNDVKIFRLSEIYFILAEVAVSEGDLSVARDYIHKVREARNYLGKATTPIYSSAQAAWADILKERRVELAFEGHRYIDLKRLAVKAGVTMDRNITDDLQGQEISNLPNGDYRYTLPIPLSEMAGNPNIQQNTGYSR